jgi:DNA-binding XRE family transcriptional regulator
MMESWLYWQMAFKRRVKKHLNQKLKNHLKLKKNISKKNNIKTLDQFVDEQYGKKGTKKRDKLEKGYESFKLGFLIQQARIEKGLTQEELAEKCGTNKGYISKIENNLKEVRISTLQKIVELGLGGHLELSIKL